MPGSNAMVAPVANEKSRIGDIACNKDNRPNMLRMWSQTDASAGRTAIWNLALQKYQAHAWRKKFVQMFYKNILVS